jgi:uncharacterized DUF497 family protein
MDYQWDPHKVQRNLRKHNISFADAVTVFLDDDAITIEDDFPKEERFVTTEWILWEESWLLCIPTEEISFG